MLQLYRIQYTTTMLRTMAASVGPNLVPILFLVCLATWKIFSASREFYDQFLNNLPTQQQCTDVCLYWCFTETQSAGINIPWQTSKWRRAQKLAELQSPHVLFLQNNEPQSYSTLWYFCVCISCTRLDQWFLIFRTCDHLKQNTVYSRCIVTRCMSCSHTRFNQRGVFVSLLTHL